MGDLIILLAILGFTALPLLTDVSPLTETGEEETPDQLPQEAPGADPAEEPAEPPAQDPAEDQQEAPPVEEPAQEEAPVITATDRTDGAPDQQLAIPVGATVNLTDEDDLLNIELPEGETGFYHLISVELVARTETVTGEDATPATAEESSFETFVVLSQNETPPDPAWYALQANPDAPEGTFGTPEAPEDETLLVRALTGSVTRLSVEVEGSDIPEVTTVGSENTDPAIVLDQDAASLQDVLFSYG